MMDIAVQTVDIITAKIKITEIIADYRVTSNR